MWLSIGPRLLRVKPVTIYLSSTKASETQSRDGSGIDVTRFGRCTQIGSAFGMAAARMLRRTPADNAVHRPGPPLRAQQNMAGLASHCGVASKRNPVISVCKVAPAWLAERRVDQLDCIFASAPLVYRRLCRSLQPNPSINRCRHPAEEAATIVQITRYVRSGSAPEAEFWTPTTPALSQVWKHASVVSILTPPPPISGPRQPLLQRVRPASPLRRRCTGDPQICGSHARASASASASFESDPGKR